MTSRHVLWIALSLGLSPLFFEATTGCDQVFSLDRPSPPTVLLDNALRCACRCDGTGDGQIAVRASSDDAEQTGALMDLTNGDGDLDLGARIVGIRFAGVGIPKDAMIQSAHVQFTATSSQSATTNYTIVAEASAAAATFTTMNNDLSGRMVGTSVPWSPIGWTTGVAGPNQQTPPLTALLQALVGQPGWSSASPVVLRIQGTGARSARSFDTDPTKAPVLVVSYTTQVEAALPVCASADAVTDAEGRITGTSLIAECGRVEETFEGLAQACGYPNPCDCEVVDVPDQDDSFEAAVCYEPCAEVPADPLCMNFDPNAFSDCLAATASVDACKQHLAATNATGNSPVCVASGSPLAFHMFGRRSLCEVAGTAQIDVSGNEPTHDPATGGTVEFLGGPCPGGGCSVHPYFDLQMAPIEFEVKWASDPRFVNMSASGRGLATALLDNAGDASFPAGTIEGTGNGSRERSGPDEGLALSAGNLEPLGIRVDWAAYSCHMEGNVVGSVDAEVPDGLCDGDGTTSCTMDSPDCDGPGGPCVFEAEDREEMLVNVLLDGELENQPPSANAGADQTPECTSTAGASFTLDGRGSSDPDQNLALASWRRGSRMGTELTKSLVVGQALGVGASETYFLRVIDALAQTGEDETTVMVKDSTPPVVSAQWLPQPALGAYPRFRVVFSAMDTCDAAPQLKGVVQTPDLTGWKFIKRRSTVSPLKLDYDLLRKTLEIRAADPDAILAQLLANGGLLVNSGQRISLIPENAYELEFELEFERNGNLKLEAPAPSLEVIAEDGSGNMAMTQVGP